MSKFIDLFQTIENWPAWIVDNRWKQAPRGVEFIRPGSWIKSGMGTYIAKSVYFSENTDLGCDVLILNDTRIGANSTINDGARIGSLCELGANLTIFCDSEVGNGCKIGCDVKIGRSCMIGSDVYIGTGVHVSSYAAIGRFSSIGPNCEINSSIGQNTTMNRNTKCSVPIGPSASVRRGIVVADLGEVDGYRKVLVNCGGVAYISAGCRWFSLNKAIEHWTKSCKVGKNRYATLQLMEVAKTIAIHKQLRLE